MTESTSNTHVVALLEQLEQGPFDCTGFVTVTRVFATCTELAIECELLSSVERESDELVCSVRTTDPDNRLYAAIVAYNNWYVEPEHRMQTDDDCWEYRIRTKRLGDRMSLGLSYKGRSEVVALARAGNVLIQEYGWNADFEFAGRAAPAAVSLRDFAIALYFVLTGEKLEANRHSRREMARRLRDVVRSPVCG